MRVGRSLEGGTKNTAAVISAQSVYLRLRQTLRSSLDSTPYFVKQRHQLVLTLTLRTFPSASLRFPLSFPPPREAAFLCMADLCSSLSRSSAHLVMRSYCCCLNKSIWMHTRGGGLRNICFPPLSDPPPCPPQQNLAGTWSVSRCGGRECPEGKALPRLPPGNLEE